MAPTLAYFRFSDALMPACRCGNLLGKFIAKHGAKILRFPDTDQQRGYLMSSLIMIPLSGAAFWLAMLYISKKFNLKSPTECGVSLKNDAAFWKKVLIYQNSIIKYGSVLLLWMTLNIKHLFPEAVYDKNIYYLITVGAVFIFTYILSLIWPLAINKNDMERFS